jgi:hypothetical protein
VKSWTQCLSRVGRTRCKRVCVLRCVSFGCHQSIYRRLLSDTDSVSGLAHKSQPQSTHKTILGNKKDPTKQETWRIKPQNVAVPRRQAQRRPAPALAFHAPVLHMPISTPHLHVTHAKNSREQQG